MPVTSKPSSCIGSEIYNARQAAVYNIQSRILIIQPPMEWDTRLSIRKSPQTRFVVTAELISLGSSKEARLTIALGLQRIIFPHAGQTPFNPIFWFHGPQLCWDTDLSPNLFQSGNANINDITLAEALNIPSWFSDLGMAVTTSE